MRLDWDSFWRVMFFFGLAIAISVAGNILARAHDHGQFGQYSANRNQWLRDQRGPGGISCCNEGDADEVEEDIRGGHYWVRKAGVFDWVPVPDDKVIDKPNPTGHPVLWWYPQRRTDGSVWPVIRCYAPGPGI